MTIRSGGTSLTPRAHAIMILDDVGIRRQAYRILSGAGYRVFEATTPGEAGDVLASAGDRLPLVIVDVAWPSYNGLELCEQMRQRYSDVRIMLTAPRSAGLDSDRLTSAKVTLILKPVGADDLLRIVREALDEAAD